MYSSPLTGFDFIVGYMLPLLPIALVQTIICYLFAIALGLTVSVNIIYAVIGIIPMAIFNISLGLLCGSVLYVSYLGTYLLNGWLKSGATPILVFSGIFISGYLIIWVIIYSIIKNKTAKLNKILKQKQQTEQYE